MAEEIVAHGRSQSPSSRRAWIEICRPFPPRWRSCVALLAEGVDRNLSALYRCGSIRQSPSSRRAWIEMIKEAIAFSCRYLSPSSRRAWIEIQSPLSGRLRASVALLAEGVDRNKFNSDAGRFLVGSPSSRRAWIEISQTRQSAPHTSSPSSRRAWIEICPLFHQGEFAEVALLAEGVDRNS